MYEQYLDLCRYRQWNSLRNTWECGLDALDCAPDRPCAPKDCPRFRETRRLCPYCLSLNQGSKLMADLEPEAGTRPEPALACPNCNWMGTAREQLREMENACSDMLADIRFEMGRSRTINKKIQNETRVPVTVRRKPGTGAAWRGDRHAR